MAVSPDGTRAVSGSDDNTVRVWDLVSGQCLATLEGHSARVWSVAVNPDGTRAVSGSYDNTARIWEVFKNKQALIDYAKTIVPRCLTKAQRQRFYLAPEPPQWCLTGKKRPYHNR